MKLSLIVGHKVQICHELKFKYAPISLGICPKKVVSKAKRYCAARNLPVKNEPLSPGMPRQLRKGGTERKRRWGGFWTEVWYLGTGLIGYIDTLATLKKCRCKRTVLLTIGFRLKDIPD